MKNKILTLILALSMLMMCLPSAVSASVLEGTDGGNLTWSFDRSTGVFTVSGEGDMYPWTAPYEVPWRNYSTQIKKVIIENGVTSISSYAFANGYVLEEVVIGDGVKEIGENAFLNAKLLTSVTIPKSVEVILQRAFCSCPMLETLVLETTSASIYYYAFENTPVTYVYYMGTEDAWDENNYSTLFYSAALYPLTVGGKAGDDIRYMLTFADESYESATLELVGTGDMYNWDDCENLAPWYKYRESIDTVIIDEGISNIGAYSFCEHTNLNYINIPFNMSYIGKGAFSGCHSLETAVYSGTRLNWDESVTVEPDNDYLLEALRLISEISYEFEDGILTVWSINGSIPDYDEDDNRAPWYTIKDEISHIIISEGIVNIGGYAFADYDNLYSLELPSSLENIGHAAFRNCPLTDINYTGSKKEWNNIGIAGENDSIFAADIHCEDSDTPVTPPVNPPSGGGGGSDDVDYPQSIWIADAEASSGDEVTVYVKAGSNVQAALGSFMINYDTNMLTYKYHEFLGELSNLSTAANPNYQNTGKFYASFMNTQNINLEGDILAITFEVAAHAPNNFCIPVMFDRVDFYYETEELSPVGFINGNIWVLNYMLGDVNNNGIIDLLDAFRVLKYDAGLLPAFTMSEEKAADANRDDIVNILDALLIQSHCAKLDTIY